MPYIMIELLEGKTREQLRRCAEGIADVVARELAVEEQRVHVRFHELPADRMAVGGHLVADRAGGKGAGR